MTKTATGFLALALFAFGAAVLPATVQAQVGIQISEVRTDNSGTDTDEYFELSGPAGASLSGLTYLVIGDTGTTCGVIESVTNLSAFSIQADGFFAARNSAATPTLTGYDASVALQFENSDNVTHMLVSGFTGTNGQDLDANDDGVLDTTPWTSVVDCVAITRGNPPACGTEDHVYCGTQLGPDANGFHPVHVYRCGGAWVIDQTGFNSFANDTPGAANACATPTEVKSWGTIKGIYR